MIRNLNFTGRKSIPRSMISIGVRTEGGSRIVDARLNLDGLALPEAAPVVVEAYRNSAFMRFTFGTVGRLQPPDDVSLAGFDPDDLVLFRVKVIDPIAAPPRLLAEADRLTPADEAVGKLSRRTILHTFVQDLGDEVWKLDVSDEIPVLLLNDRIPGIKPRAKTGDDFGPLVFPSVVRTLLSQAAIGEGAESDDDSATWPTLWVRWGEALTGEAFPPGVDDDQKMEWVEAVVAAFCKLTKATDRYRRIS
jgi:hypothetical protein